MRIKKNLMAMAMALALAVSCIPAAFAADNVVSDPGAGTTPVTITAEATQFNVTVPTSIAIHLKSNGTVTCPDPGVVKIINNSAGAVKVTDVSMQNSAWTVVDYNGGNRSVVAAAGVDSKLLGMQFTAGGTTIATKQEGTHSLASNPENWKMTGVIENDELNTSDELPITCAAIASAVSSAITAESNVTAASVIFTLAWDTIA